MTISAQNPTDRVEQLILLTDRLTEITLKQAQAFEAHRPQDAATLLDETSKLANVYRHESARIQANPALIEGAPPSLRLTLIRSTEAFDAVLARQGRAVNAARVVTEGLVKAIADEVASQRHKGSTYGPGATVAASPTGVATAITLNKRA